MKTILLWDRRFPERAPARLTLDDDLASACVRAGVAAAADPAQQAALAAGGALDPSNPIDAVIEHGALRQLARVALPASVVAIGVAMGIVASLGPSVPPADLPSFVTAPSIAPASGDSATMFTAVGGAVTNGAVTGRRWLLNGTAIGTGTTIVPGAAGSLVLENTATGPGGTRVATSAPVTVSSAAAAPVLTGPLDIVEPTGEAVYTADKPARHYWMLSAPGSTPTAAEIAAGTGALAGASASAFGYFDAADGSVSPTINFPAGISATGAVFSVVARVEPDGAWSNALRDTSVNVDTGLLTSTYIGTQNGYQCDFGICPAGWYLVIAYQRNGTMTSLTPPGQTAITAAEIDVVPIAASGIKPMRAYLVELTQQRSGNWTLAASAGTSYGMSLYRLSAKPTVVAKASDFVNNGAKTFTFNMAVQQGDVEIGALNGHVFPAPAQDTTDDVAQDATGQIIANHIYRVCSGVAPASGTRLVYKDADAGGSAYASALALVLRRAA